MHASCSVVAVRSARGSQGGAGDARVHACRAGVRETMGNTDLEEREKGNTGSDLSNNGLDFVHDVLLPTNT